MGIEGIVVGYLFIWGVRRAKPIGDRVGEITDKAFQAALGKLETVITARLGSDSALGRLNDEAEEAAQAEAPPVGPSTGAAEALTYALQRAAKKDPAFAQEIGEALAAVRAADPDSTANGGVISHGGGTTAGGDVTINASGPDAVAVGGNARDITTGTSAPTAHPPATKAPAGPSTPGPHQS